MNENMTMQKPCPFCGGIVKLTGYRTATYEIDTEAKCTGCGMEFAYSQDFKDSTLARAACRPSFETVWNQRIKEE